MGGLAAGLSAALRSEGYELHDCFSGEEAPQLILAIRFIPDRDGKEMLRRLRLRTAAPVIALCSRDQESDIVASLDAGADDCLAEPVSQGELFARIRAALRRSAGAAPGEVLTAGELKIDVSRRQVFFGEEQIRLTATEYHLLNVLVRRAGQVTTHRQLIHEVWGSTQYRDAAHLLRVTVSNLRRKLAGDSRLRLPIVTEPGVGYRLQ
jgi:two-component system KDP operon response regulator KdpE